MDEGVRVRMFSLAGVRRGRLLGTQRAGGEYCVAAATVEDMCFARITVGR